MAKLPHPPMLRPETDVLTRGFDPSLSVGSARPAVFRSSTYVFSSPEAAERAFDLMGGRGELSPGESVDLVYSRFNHPNAEILEDQIVPLEPGAAGAAVFNSGMAAIMTVLFAVLKPGHSVIYTVPIYGATQTLIRDFLQPFGIVGIPVPAGDTSRIAEAIRSAKNLAVVLIETPANPTIVMTDIRSACLAAGEPRGSELASNGNGAHAPERPLVMIDNTFLGPAFQHPLALGADVSLYSATKYLGGYSDIIGGVALVKDLGLLAKIRSKRSLFGNILQPDECWILDTRLPTVSLRMNRQSKNAKRIAEHLVGASQDTEGLLSQLVRRPRADPHQSGTVRLPGRHHFPGPEWRKGRSIRLLAQYQVGPQRCLLRRSRNARVPPSQHHSLLLERRRSRSRGDSRRTGADVDRD